MSFFKKQRTGQSSDIARLDIHGWNGLLQDRIKWRIGQKEIAVNAIDRIMERESLTIEKIKEIRRKLKEQEKKDFVDMHKDSRRKMGFNRKPFTPLEKKPVFIKKKR